MNRRKVISIVVSTINATGSYWKKIQGTPCTLWKKLSTELLLSVLIGKPGLPQAVSNKKN